MPTKGRFTSSFFSTLKISAVNNPTKRKLPKKNNKTPLIIVMTFPIVECETISLVKNKMKVTSINSGIANKDQPTIKKVSKRTKSKLRDARLELDMSHIRITVAKMAPEKSVKGTSIGFAGPGANFINQV